MRGGERSASRNSDRGGSVSATRTKADPTLDKFDFPCFVTFLIKLGPKVYPEINESQLAVSSLIEDFIMPLYQNVSEAKQAQNNQISKLINLVNHRVMVDFMSELFCTL